jgi:RNase H-like domain found in reverse transcriptase
MAKPLIQLTRKDTPFIFNNDYIEAFRELKHRLISSLILCYYNPDLKLILETDASDGVVAEVLL